MQVDADSVAESVAASLNPSPMQIDACAVTDSVETSPPRQYLPYEFPPPIPSENPSDVPWTRRLRIKNKNESLHRRMQQLPESSSSDEDSNPWTGLS